MKSLLQTISALFLLGLFVLPLHQAYGQDTPPPPPPDPNAQPADSGDQGDASFQTFYDQLGSQGTWVNTDNYGYVWQPQVSDPNWAPYTQGHWVYTDQGWTWVSDESFGWATYHYGRWANIDGTGWVWVPGYRWAPAWVSWRYGGGYAGWAPLPPETVIGAEYGDNGDGYHFGNDVDVSFGIGAGMYNFLQIGYMGDPSYQGHYEDRYNNYGIINRTRNITNFNLNGGRGFAGVSAGGPSINDVNAHSHQHVQTVQLTNAAQPGRANVQGNSLAVYAPRVDPATRQQAKPASVSQTLSHPVFNRGTSISKPLEVRPGLQPAGATPQQVSAAHEAMAKAPASAKIAKTNAAPKTTVNKPLTSMKPVNQARPAGSADHPNEANPATPNANASAAATPHPDENNAVNHPQNGVNPSSSSSEAADAAAKREEQDRQQAASQSSDNAAAERREADEAQKQKTEATHTESSNSGEASHSETHTSAEPQHESEPSHTESHPQAEAPHPQAEAPHPQAEAPHPQSAPASHPQSAPAPHPAAAAKPSAPAAKSAPAKDAKKP